MINDIDIPNQQSQSLYFSTLQLTDAGVYKCRVTTGTGTTLYSREITVNNITAVSEFPEIISGFIAYPNPFIAATRLAWEQKSGAALSLDILDIQGNVVTQLLNSYSGCGKHEQELNAGNLKPGNYIARLGINGKFQNIRIVFIK
jgi:AICAR transformylase/IMP cyclohydrolase PurH